MLHLDHVSVEYDGTPAVIDATLAVPDGAVVAVLGPSGSGKSTLLRAVAGLERPSAGRISWDDVDLRGVPTHKRGFALMFQDGQLFAHLTVARNVGYALRLRRSPRLRERTAELLALVGLEGYGERLPTTLSGGERQRVALARSLAADPRLLLLDEPLSALDATLRERLAADLRAILRRSGATTLLVTHDQEEAFAIADHLVVTRAGRIVQQGPIAEVWAAPVDADTALFLGYARVLDGAAARRVLEVADLDPAPEVAVRRSALTAGDPGGPGLAGTVVAARATPDQVRLVVDIDGVGEVDAVASPSSRFGHAGPGERITVTVDASRLARIAARPPLG